MKKRWEILLRKVDAFTSRFMPADFYKYYMIGMAAVYVINFFLWNFSRSSIDIYIGFSRADILKGQVWRIVTFPLQSFYSYDMMGIFFALIAFSFYFWIFRTIAAMKGSARLNTYFLTTFIALIVTGFITGYAGMTAFHYAIAFIAGLVYPSFTVYVNFIIPVKGWIVSILSLGMMIYIIATTRNPSMIAILLAALAVFGPDVINAIDSIRGKAVKKASGPVKSTAAKAEPKYRHKCTVCGKTDITDPHMTFRYCSQCQGAFEYCEDHIRNHEHRTNIVEFNKKHS